MNDTLSPSVIFRRRSGWEATDMGVFLWRNNLLPLLIFTLIPSIFLLAITQTATIIKIDWLNNITFLFIWWVKPLMDRFILHVVSIRFFEGSCSIRRLFKGLGKTIKTGLLGDLLWRRFSAIRSAAMPLRVLERLNGSNYKRRKQLLNRNGLGFGLPLTLICIGIISSLNVGEMVFANSIINMVKGTGTNFMDFIAEYNGLISILYLLNIILVETLYVCMGFSLYINSRVETEGWDIELLFKTCVEKNKKSHHFQKPAVLPLAGSFLILFFLFVPCKSAALETVDPSRMEQQNYGSLIPQQVSAEAETNLEQILKDPKFGTEKDTRRIRLKNPNNRKQPQFRNPFNSSLPLEEIMGQLLRFIIVAAILAALGFAAFYTYRQRSRIFGREADEKSSIDDPARPEECAKLLKQAEEYHKKGETREAWAMCFRAFLSVFTSHWFVHFPAEATEYESLAMLHKSTGSGTLSKSIKSFEEFIRYWISFAYGGREPAAGSFEQAVASCRLLLISKKDNTE